MALGIVLTPPAGAAPGDLDPSFGGDGRLALPGAGAFVPRAVAIDGRDRIVIAGYLCQPTPGGDGTCLADGNSSFRLARLTADGGLDPEFGQNGFVTTPLGDSRSQALDLVIEPDGKLVAGGVARSGGRDEMAVVRYESDGALDPGFGDHGTALIGVGSSFSSVADVALGPGGTVLAAGQAVDADGVPRMAVMRLTSAGHLDAGFGAGGVTLAGPWNFGYALALSVSGGGAPLLAGVAGDSIDSQTFRFGEISLTKDGAPNDAFDGDGAAEQAVGGSSSFANAVSLLGGDGFLAAGAGTVPDGRQAMAIERVGVTGAPVASFGHGGKTEVPIGDGAVANDLVLDSAGRPLLVGQAAHGAGYDFATVRLQAGGAVDPGYGVADVRFPGYPIARATAGALQRGGKLVTVGVGCRSGSTSRCVGGSPVLLLARQAGGEPNPAITVPRTLTRTRLRDGVWMKVKVPYRVWLRARLVGRRHGGGHVTLLSLRSTRKSSSFRVQLRARAATLARTRSGPLRLIVRCGPARATRTITLRG